jgi:hypothetical protein
METLLLLVHPSWNISLPVKFPLARHASHPLGVMRVTSSCLKSDDDGTDGSMLTSMACGVVTFASPMSSLGHPEAVVMNRTTVASPKSMWLSVAGRSSDGASISSSPENRTSFAITSVSPRTLACPKSKISPYSIADSVPLPRSVTGFTVDPMWIIPSSQMSPPRVRSAG